jgi:hypothetical protein
MEPLFDATGRRIPPKGAQVFSREGKDYYKTPQPEVNTQSIWENTCQAFGSGSLSLRMFRHLVYKLRDNLQQAPAMAGILHGPCIPFFLPKSPERMDLGEEMEQVFLPAVGQSFTAAYPQESFKVNLTTGAPPLPESLMVAPESRYRLLLAARAEAVIVGLYFPLALREYAISSQRKQMPGLPIRISASQLILSGGFDVAAALAGTPELLVNSEAYTHVLCLSGFAHADPELMACFQAYGAGLQFWVMSNMLQPGVEQVSEQFSGGLTYFTVA